MTEQLILTYLAYGIAGGTLVVLVTYLADNFGAKVGGLLSAFPTVTSVSLIIIAINQGTGFAADAALSTTFGLVAAMVFSLGFFYGQRVRTTDKVYRTVIATVSGFFVYFVTVFAYLMLTETTSVRNFLLLIVATAVIHTVLNRSISDGQDVAQDRYVGPVEYALKACFGGGIVIAATLLGDISGPVLGGVFAAFPATVAPILIIISLTQPAEFLHRMITFTPSALLGTGAFVLGVWYAFPRFGILIGTIVGYLLYGASILLLSSVNTKTTGH
jgi:uncharacterized membrane protein (GlpM family)